MTDYSIPIPQTNVAFVILIPQNFFVLSDYVINSMKTPCMRLSHYVCVLTIFPSDFMTRSGRGCEDWDHFRRSPIFSLWNWNCLRSREWSCWPLSGLFTCSSKYLSNYLSLRPQYFFHQVYRHIFTGPVNVFQVLPVLLTFSCTILV